MRKISPVLSIALPVHCAIAQSATISVTHDDPNGVVDPGAQVTIAARMLHSGFLMVGRWRGDVLPSPSSGGANNVVWGVGLFNGFNGVMPGTVQGGGLADSLFLASSPFFTPVPPQPWVSPDFEFLRYTWTAPTTPGVYHFTWTPHPDFPLVEGYATAISIPLTPYPTTYLGTSLTVTPAAPALGTLVLAGVAAGRRRREQAAKQLQSPRPISASRWARAFSASSLRR